MTEYAEISLTNSQQHNRNSLREIVYTENKHFRKHSAISILLSLFIFIGICLPSQEVKAMDPVTIALLTPIAIKVAKIALPYVLAGLKELGVGLIQMGGEILNIFRLPLGFLEISLGAPFGLFSHGIYNIVLGGMAPFKLTLIAITLPIRPFGAVF